MDARRLRRSEEGRAIVKRDVTSIDREIDHLVIPPCPTKISDMQKDVGRSKRRSGLGQSEAKAYNVE
jgi:hypothetical protein